MECVKELQVAQSGEHRLWGWLLEGEEEMRWAGLGQGEPVVTRRSLGAGCPMSNSPLSTCENLGSSTSFSPSVLESKAMAGGRLCVAIAGTR